MDTNAQPLYFASPAQWRKWLEQHGQKATEIWIGIYKKTSGKTGLTYDQALDEALCFGWIDGLMKGIDEISYKLRFTPRRPRSNWSAPNIQRVETLIKTGRMTPAGLQHITAAKADGRWRNS